MSLNDLAADRQSDTHTVALGRVKGIEQPLKVLRIDAGPGILHAQTHAIVCFPARSDQQAPRAVVNTSHGVGSIAEQIQDDLLELDTISGDGRKFYGEFRLQDHPTPLKIAH